MKWLATRCGGFTSTELSAAGGGILRRRPPKPVHTPAKLAALIYNRL